MELWKQQEGRNGGRGWTPLDVSRLGTRAVRASALVRCRRAAVFRSLTVGPVSSARCCGLVGMPRRRRCRRRDENDRKPLIGDQITSNFIFFSKK